MKQDGYSIFETSAVVALLAGVVLSVVAVSNYLSERRYALEVLDRGLSSVLTKPVVLDQFGKNFVTNQRELEAQVDKLAQTVFEEAKSKAQNGRRLEVSVAYAEVEIDEQTGISLGLKIEPVTYQKILGTEVKQDSSFDAEFKRLADLQTEEQSFLAVPLGSLESRFVPIAVLLGARVCLELATYSNFCVSKVATLRGDIGL